MRALRVLAIGLAAGCWSTPLGTLTGDGGDDLSPERDGGSSFDAGPPGDGGAAAADGPRAGGGSDGAVAAADGGGDPGSGCETLYEYTPEGLTGSPFFGRFGAVRLSNDGARLAAVVSRPSGFFDGASVYTLEVDAPPGIRAVQLDTPRSQLAFSGDGSGVYYSEDGVKRVSFVGGIPTTIVSTTGLVGGGGGLDVAGDDRFVVLAVGNLLLYDTWTGSPPSSTSLGSGWNVYARFSPDERAVAYFHRRDATNDYELRVRSLPTGTEIVAYSAHTSAGQWEDLSFSWRDDRTLLVARGGPIEQVDLGPSPPEVSRFYDGYGIHSVDVAENGKIAFATDERVTILRCW